MNLSDPTNLLIAGIYTVLVGGLALFSLFGVYILIRYGKSQITTLLVSVLYSVIFLSVVTASYNTLVSLLQ